MITVETFTQEVKNLKDNMLEELAVLNGRRDQLVNDISKLNHLLMLMNEANDNGKENK